MVAVEDKAGRRDYTRMVEEVARHSRAAGMALVAWGKKLAGRESSRAWERMEPVVASQGARKLQPTEEQVALRERKLELQRL